MSSLSNIVNQMKLQHNTTLNWDVAVNYGETELNNLLASAHKADPTGNKTVQKLEWWLFITSCVLAARLRFSSSLTATDDLTGEDYSINYTLNLGPPLITFLDTDNGAACDLLISITGGNAEIPGATIPSQSFGEGIYTLGLNTLLLATAEGGVSSDEASVQRATSYDEPFVFSANSEESGIVYIDFEASKELVIELKTTGAEGHAALVDNHIGDLKDIIRNQFLTVYKHIVYELARTNNIKPQDGIQLVPKSFMFTTHTPAKGETILSLLIRTGDADRGEKDYLHSQWDVLWHTIGYSPIPSGQTASVILAKNTIFTTMIEPGLKRQGYSSQLDDAEGSLQLQVDTKKELHEPDDSESSWYSSITRHTAIDLVLPTLRLVLQQDSSKPYCRGSWEYSYRFSWDEYQATGETGVDKHGTVTVTNILAEDDYPVTLEDEYTLRMSFTIRKDKWNVTTKPDSQSFWDIINGGSETTPSWVKDLNVFLPEMNIDLGSLNFFLTTNLLLPSGNVIDIDTSVGVQIPGDFYLVGSVAAGIDT